MLLIIEPTPQVILYLMHLKQPRHEKNSRNLLPNPTQAVPDISLSCKCLRIPAEKGRTKGPGQIRSGSAPAPL